PAYAGVAVDSGAATSRFSHCLFEYGPVRDESAVSTIADCLFDHTGGQFSLYAPNGANPIVRCTAQFNRDPTFAGGHGIGAGTKGLANCVATGNLGIGLIGGTLEGCVAQENDGHGMVCFSIARLCRAVKNGGRGIHSFGNVEECFAAGNGHGDPSIGWGIRASDRVSSSRAVSNYHGVQASGVEGTTAIGNGPPTAGDPPGIGIQASVTTRCLAIENHGVGVELMASTAIIAVADCYIVRNEQGLVLAGDQEVARSRISENEGDGVASGVILSCVVDHNAGDGAVSSAFLSNSWVVGNGGWGVREPDRSCFLNTCRIDANASGGVLLPPQWTARVQECTVEGNGGIGVDAVKGLLDLTAGIGVSGSTIINNKSFGIRSVNVEDSNIYGNQGSISLNDRLTTGVDYIEERSVVGPITPATRGWDCFWGGKTANEMLEQTVPPQAWPPDPVDVPDGVINVRAIFDHKDDNTRSLVDFWGGGAPGPNMVELFPPAEPDNSPPPFLRRVTPNPDRAVGAGPTTFTLEFSQDMKITGSLSVTFGSTSPYIQHVVRPRPALGLGSGPGWRDSRVWQGWFVIRDDTGDGPQHIRVAGAETLDGRPMPADSGNRFDIDLVGGLCANNGLASALATTNMYLEWGQNGKPAGAQGYNVRRSATGMPGSYSKVNSSLIGAPSEGNVSHNDLSVGPGTAYFYTVDLVDAGSNSIQWTPPFVGITPGDPWTPTPEVTATPTPTLTPATTPSPTPEGTATPAFTSTPTPTPPVTETPTPDVTPTPTISPIRQLIISFYNIILARDPEPGAVEAWEIGYFEYAVSFNIDVRFIPREMARLFFLSEEYTNRSRTNAEFITDCYQVFLGRAPSQIELDNWLGGVWNRAQVMTVFSESEEFANRIQAMYPQYGGDPTRNFVTTMYVGLLDRLVDSAGLEYAAGLFEVARLQGGIEAVRAQAKQMGREVIVSPEFLSKDPTNEGRVARLYRAFLGRFPNDSEIAYWSGLLDAGARTPNDLIDLFAEAPEFTNRLEEFF
ncbi:MAG TPA: DUF4214 domain-containing protein, partial [Sumerlaeia bacterium]|nr:DUF4214 domain-containing protein [Sumerlaeia bacterium]